MRRLLLIFLFVSASALAQTHAGSKLLVVMPFENASSAPGIDWIGESFSEILTSRLNVSGLYVIPRADRLYALDRMGIPATSRPSRATLYQIADQMDVDYVVSGSYSFDGKSFSARAQVMDVHRMRLSPQVTESGALTQLLDIQDALAWELLHILNATSISKDSFVRAAAPVRLDALENYIRGVIATDSAEKVRFLKQAVRINPDYTDANFLLGRTYFAERDYANAIVFLGKVPPQSVLANEANFYLGLAAHYTGNFDRAEQAFAATAGHIPLIEVTNNLGVALARRGKKGALELFQRAVAADPRDPDYHFNYGVALYRSGDSSAAAKQLRDALGLRPQDAEAKSFLDQLVSPTAASVKVPLERIKRNYDETSYRQLVMEIENAREQRFVGMPPTRHAAEHVERGFLLIGQSLSDEAESEFREAILLDPANARAHLGLAQVLEAHNDLEGARSEIRASLQLGATADAYLVLAGLDLKQNRLDSARENIDQAGRLDPANPGLPALRRALAERQAGKPSSESQP